MRRVAATTCVMAVALMATMLVAQTKPSFAGDWMLIGPDGQGVPETTLAIAQTATTMTLESGGCGGQPRSGRVAYQLDGSASQKRVIGRAGGAAVNQTSKATWAGNTIVVTTITGVGEQRQTVSMNGSNLVIETSVAGRSGGPATSGKSTYTRYECGFGG